MHFCFVQVAIDADFGEHSRGGIRVVDDRGSDWTHSP